LDERSELRLGKPIEIATRQADGSAVDFSYVYILQGRDALRVLMEETAVTARAGALAAADEGVHRCTRGGCAPRLL
jgi:hypothetical protein